MSQSSPTEPTPSQVDSVLFLDDQDYAPAEIAEVVGLAVEQVRRVLVDRAVIEGRAPGSEPTQPVRRPIGRPRLLTAQQLAEARELRSDGASYRRIADLYHCSAETVRSALSGPDTSAEDAPSPPPPAPAALPAEPPEPRPEPSWPPPVTEHTRWSEVLVPTGGRTAGQPTHRAVKVRSVLLWGKAVLVTEDGLSVWCPACQAFLTHEQLVTEFEHPISHPRPPGPWVVDLDKPTPGEPMGPVGGGFRDLMRTPW